MIHQYVRQLKSDDPTKRRAAIMALANSKDPAALKVLAVVFKSDPDPELRELALKGGQYVRDHLEALVERQRAQTNATLGPGAMPGEHIGPAPALPDPTTVSERDKRIARGLLNAATDHHMAGDKPRAAENLGKALSVDPGLKEHNFAQNLIMNVTGASVNDGFTLLTHPDRRNALIQSMGGKQKLTRQQSHGTAAHTATWENVAMDFGLYWLTITMAMIAVFLFMLVAIQELFEEAGMGAGPGMGDSLESLIAASLLFLIIGAVFNAIYQVIMMAVQGVFIHLAATIVFGGDGTLVYLYRRYVPLQTVVILVAATIFTFGVFLGDITALMVIFGLGGFIGILLVGYLQAKIVGEVYNFGAWSGCGAIIIGGIVQSFVFGIGNTIMMNVTAKLFGG